MVRVLAAHRAAKTRSFRKVQDHGIPSWGRSPQTPLDEPIVLSNLWKAIPALLTVHY